MKPPRLVVASGRSREDVQNILGEVESKSDDERFLKSICELHSKHIPGHVYRGYVLVGVEEPSRDIQYFSGDKRPVWFLYPGMGCQWFGMGKDLLRLEIFSESIDKCNKILEPFGIDVRAMYTSKDEHIYDRLINSYSAIAALQVGLTDVLHAFGIFPDFIAGHSAGELPVAYADGCFTTEQAVLSCYYRGRTLEETDLIHGAMYVVMGVPEDQLLAMLPPEIDLGCINGHQCYSISGPVDVVNDFVKILEKEGIRHKLFDSGKMAFHSRYITKAGPRFKAYLEKLIPKPKPRSSRWICSSLSEKDWGSENAKYCSAEYHTNNLVSRVLYGEALKHIPNNAITIEIAPYGIFQSVLKRTVPPDTTNVALGVKFSEKNLEHLLSSLGKLYLSGVQMDASVQFQENPQA